MSFDDAATLHVLRAIGVTYAELSLMFGERNSRVTQVLEGDLYGGSWESALERLERHEYWHPRVASFAEQLGSVTLAIAVRANDPARRSYQRSLKRLRKTTIPFVTERRLWELATRRAG